MTSYGIIEYNSNGNIYKQLERINKGIIKVSDIKLISFYLFQLILFQICGQDTRVLVLETKY